MLYQPREEIALETMILAQQLVEVVQKSYSKYNVAGLASF